MFPAYSPRAVSSDRPPLRLVRYAPRRRPGRAEAARRARRVVVWALLTLLLTQAAAAVAVFTRDASRSDPEYGLRLERLRRRSGPAAGNPLSILVLGSSRTQMGLRGGYLETQLAEALGRPVVVVNFAVSGAGPVTELFLWRRLERDGVRPDLVLVEVHPSLLSANRTPGGELNERVWPVYRLSWSDLDAVERYAGDVQPAARKQWLLSAANPLGHVRIGLLSRLCPQLVPWQYGLVARSEDLDTSGQLPLDELPPSADERQRYLELARRQYQQDLQTFRLEPTKPGGACENLCELLAACRTDGVRTALLVMPEGPEFRSWYPPGVWDTIHTWLTRTSAEYDAPLIDSRDWMAEPEFRDSHHLTFAGATHFTGRLAGEEMAPRLRELRPGAGERH